MSRHKERPTRGHKLEIKIIPPNFLDLPLVEITHLLGDGPLLWPGGAGRAKGLKFEQYELKKKRGRKPKSQKTPQETNPGPAGKNLP
ncbi:MAG: hypothetical protein PHU44_17040 [Syntrophales bacterium]|nr:hypothetical protein [Syntrophales bacterium]MDD5641648.1 hypothetical protein [Syntrophales bacterium]